MTLLKDNNYKDINVALLSLEADIKNKITGSFDTSEIDKQLAEINSRIDKINAGGSGNSSEEIEDINSKLNSNSIKIKNIEQNVEDIGTQINGIEQRLSDIFSAENKVTDFNTTTTSGIYYWVIDAANKPGTDYGVLLVNKYDSGSGASNLWINQVAYGTNNKIYFRQNINSGSWTEWKAVAFEGEGKANFLDEYVGAGGTRLTSGNIVPKDASEYGGMRKDVVTSSMTDGNRPGQDGHLLTMFWDNTGRYDSQLFVSNEKQPKVKVRTKQNREDYGPWTDIITSNDIGSQTVASAGSADTILDYVKGTPIKVRWGGPGINSAEWYPAFNADGSAIEPINRANIHAGTADTDANGNNIVNTYATKTELEKTTTKGASLSAVTTNTTKYIKLGTFHWYDSFSFKCRIAGNSLEDNVNINILGGISTGSSVCGYYSTNSRLTRSIIVKRGEAWNSDLEIYLKIVQLTDAEVYVTIDKVIQDRINISESTTAPSGTLEEIAFNNLNGMFSGNIEANNLTLPATTSANLGAYGKDSLSIGFPSGTGDGLSLGFDRNSMQARANGSASVMYLNYYGGMVHVNETNKSDGGLKVKNKMVIPIGAPSSLEDGCIWIER